MRASSQCLRRSPIVAGMLVAAATMLAQSPQPLVLVHGFYSDASAWDGTASYFQQNLPVKTYAWTLSWADPLHTQANRLNTFAAQAGLPDTSILIGHSNGGLISRDASRAHAYKGIITVGTLHSGAQLAASAYYGGVESLGIGIWVVGTNAAQDYNTGGDGDTPICDSDTDEYCDWFNVEAVGAALAEAGLGTVITGASTAFLADALVNNYGALLDMQPGSAFLNSLNAQANLDREAQALGSRRVGITSHYRGDAMLTWAGVDAGNSEGLSYLTQSVWYTLSYAYDYYRNYDQYDDPDYWWKVGQADDWLYAAAALGSLDESWCALIGAGDLVNCGDSDGIVPVDAQRYPGDNVTNLDIYGPAHEQEIDSDAFRRTAANYLANTFNVQQPPATPGVSVDIAGAYPTQPGYYTYTASASGGSGSFGYSWSLSTDGTNYYDTGVSASSYTLYVDTGSNYWLEVVVTSGTSSASTIRYIPGPCTSGGIIC